ncbi:phage replication initiation protein [Pygmaiobacter massiliensis]|uniref:phage replication initiation protein n=1 Tax=Pygmaiobacter massiliensis TaxID=1917873 RepID=UPI002A80A677|nr:phage replication initiation protein [Pygmaiobacter massiliensis]MDY4785495.1 phage replication initiation protein [Pygmaiobacter massiliensis]
MAERRMFAKTIIDSDAFLEMPQSCQLLYFHLAMRADDDGFINNPKAIMRNVGSKDDDIRLLISKKFIIPFESGIVVIKHWKIHNYIRNDRYKETKYMGEKQTLSLDENGAYTDLVDDLDTNGIPVVSKMDTQVRLGKVRLGKVSKEEEFLSDFSPEMQDALQRWLQYKAERRETYKPTGLKALVSEIKNKLKIHPEASVIELINTCMANGWRGIIWDKLEGGQKQNGNTGKSATPRSTYQGAKRL